MDEIAKLKLIIQEFESSNVPLTKPKLTNKKIEELPKPVDKKPEEVKQNEVIQELPSSITNPEVQEVKTEKKKKLKTPAQLESFKKAQEARKLNIENKKKQKEYEGALKLLEHYETLKYEKQQQKQQQQEQQQIVKKKKIKQPEPETESESEEEDEEEELPQQPTRVMKSMKNKKYNQPSINNPYKPKPNFFAD